MLNIVRKKKRVRKDQKPECYNVASPPRVVFYQRVSNDRLKEENQWDEFKRTRPDLISIVGEPVTDIVEGDGERVNLRELLDTLPEGSTIYTVAIDRLSRGTIDFALIMQRAIERGIKIISLRHGDLNLMDPAVLGIYGIIAEMEKRNLSMRTKAAVQLAMEKRGGLWGHALVKAKAEAEGKDFKDIRKRRPVSKHFLDALPEIRELRAKGLTLNKIAEIMTYKHGHEFSVPNISNLLKHGRG